MDSTQIMELLKEITFPGFSRNIVSFGIVKDIVINDDSIMISINISNSDHQEILEKQIINLVTDKTSCSDVKVIFSSVTKEESKNNNEFVQASIPGVKYTIAIASGKGGVGKSTVAMNLASTLSKDYKVGILDLDIYGPSLPTILGINDQPELTKEKKIIPIECHQMKVMSFGLINSNNAPTIWRGPMVARLTQQFFDDVLWGDLDYLIIDLPPGTGDIQLTLVQKIALSGAIIITTPQDLSLIDASKAADMFNKVNTPLLGIIENMSYFLVPGTDEKIQIFPGNAGKKESERLGIPLLGEIMISPDISSSSDSGTPYVLKYQDSVISNIFSNMAEKIINNLD